MSDYTWAENRLKLDRAIKKATIDKNTDGTEFNEESVKAWYIKLGGRLIKEVKKAGRPKNADKNPDLVPEE